MIIYIVLRFIYKYLEKFKFMFIHCILKQTEAEIWINVEMMDGSFIFEKHLGSPSDFIRKKYYTNSTMLLLKSNVEKGFLHDTYDRRFPRM